MRRSLLVPTREIRVGLIALVLSAIPSLAATDSSEWLMKMNKAAAEISFSGTFVYFHDDTIEAMQVARKIENGMMQERLFSLNGEPREIIRGMNKVWCYIPDQNVVVHDYRQTSQSGFPRMLPESMEQLQKYYSFAEGTTERVANRMAKQIRVIPRDRFRYGYSLWADSETGLLLRSDLVDMDNNIIEQYLFIQLDIGGPISDAELQPVSKADDLKLFGNDMPMSEKVHDSVWMIKELPAGYVLSNHIRRMSPMESGEVEHLVFTDGLSTVSIFIKKSHAAQSDMTGLSKMGAVHAYRITVGDHRVTVMGEVPADTVEMLANGVAMRN